MMVSSGLALIVPICLTILIKLLTEYEVLKAKQKEYLEYAEQEDQTEQDFFEQEYDQIERAMRAVFAEPSVGIELLYTFDTHLVDVDPENIQSMPANVFIATLFASYFTFASLMSSMLTYITTH